MAFHASACAARSHRCYALAWLLRAVWAAGAPPSQEACAAAGPRGGQASGFPVSQEACAAARAGEGSRGGSRGAAAAKAGEGLGAGEDGALALLQQARGRTGARRGKGGSLRGPADGGGQPRACPSGIVFTHLPYNFGHTVESAVLVGDSDAWHGVWGASVGASIYNHTKAASWIRALLEQRFPNSSHWGAASPLLQDTSPETGCKMYFTPPKLWEPGLAERYFGDSSCVVGILRDPAERLVAQFRGDTGDYGTVPGVEVDKATCNVDAGVNKLLDAYEQDEFTGSCAFLPQAEFFDGPHGINYAVDNSLFPDSFNEVLLANGYSAIKADHIMHVSDCENVWSGDLSCETRVRIHSIYKRDYELLCTNFGHCNPYANVCISKVPKMCPPDYQQRPQVKACVSTTDGFA